VIGGDRIWIGWDADQMRASTVAEFSAGSTARWSPDVRRLALGEMIARGLYTRPTIYPSDEHPGYWDEISEAPMSTAHAIARFLVPALCEYKGWALFTDGDVLFRRDVRDLFALADPQYAVQVVKHDYAPPAGSKMEGQTQTRYARKNWSSVILWHCGHPANQALTVGMINRLPGRDLHRFCWLDDSLIGALPPEWNWLVGHSDQTIDPAIVHFTEGVCDTKGYEHVAYSDEWYSVARACGFRLIRPPQAESEAA